MSMRSGMQCTNTKCDLALTHELDQTTNQNPETLELPYRELLAYE